jgi:hypothetical protein
MIIIRKTVTLVGCGEERYRRYLLEQLAVGYDVVLLLDQEPTWQSPLVSETVRIADFRPRTLEAALADIRARGGSTASSAGTSAT